MQQFKNILVVGPFSEQLLVQATSLMTTFQSELTLMSIVPRLEVTTVTTSDGQDVDLQDLLKRDIFSQLESTAKKLDQRKFLVNTQVSSGDHLSMEVIHQVLANDHDLVMMVADGSAGIKDRLFGTESMNLMRKCPCPVWVVKPSRRKAFRNIFAAVDPVSTDPVKSKLNSQILRRAATIAQNHQAQLHVIHTWQPISTDRLGRYRWMGKQEMRLYDEKVGDQHRRQLKELCAAHLNGTERVHLLQGRHGEVIAETVDRANADLLVMGTVCRTGIPGFFIGNTAESILNEVDCSVLTIKPEGFVSPVAGATFPTIDISTLDADSPLQPSS